MSSKIFKLFCFISELLKACAQEDNYLSHFPNGIINLSLFADFVKQFFETFFKVRRSTVSQTAMIDFIDLNKKVNSFFKKLSNFHKKPIPPCFCKKVDCFI